MSKTFTCEHWKADTEEELVERKILGKLTIESI